MNTTGLFEVYSYPIKFSTYGEPIYLIPFGDVHRSSPNCHKEKWLEFLEWAKTKENAYFLGMGDYDDLASASERKILGGDSGLHESTMETLEELYNHHVYKFFKEIEFMKGRMVGIMSGNHFARFQSGINSDQKLADLLGCKFLGSATFVRLQLSQNTKHNAKLSVDVWAHHGMGASRLVGGSLSRVQQMAESAEADIYLMGHDHKKSVAFINRLRLVSGRGVRLTHRKILMARTGSFLKGYVEGKPTYIADRALNPTDLGVVKIELTPKRIHRGGVDVSEVDIHASI